MDSSNQYSRNATSYSSNDPYDDIEIITTRIESARIDITSGYAAWRDLGFALSDALGENGRTYYQRISRFHPEYSAEETDKQYDKCLRAHGTGVTIKTFFQIAKEHGISISIPSKTSNTSNTCICPAWHIYSFISDFTFVIWDIFRYF